MAAPSKGQADSFNTKQTTTSIEQNKYPQRMQQILANIENEPMSILGQKMFYKSTNQLSQKRDLNPLYDTLETLDFDVSSKATSQHHARVVRGLLYLSINGIDECHNLVTPLSWPSHTSFGGQSISNSPASQNACYAHALVHRREGQNIGEFGTGWNNSNFWFGQTGQHRQNFPLIANYAYDVVYGQNKTETQYSQNKSITTFLQSMAILSVNNKKESKAQFHIQWDPCSFTNLCETAVNKKDKTLMKYCTDVANKEWRLLTDLCFTFI